MNLINSTTGDAQSIAAYQRGWNEAQQWREPHLNPYPCKTPQWWAWQQGYDEGRPQLHYDRLSS